MHNSRIVVSTITLARDADESETILQGLHALSEKGFPAIVVADGGSGQDFLTTMARIPGVVLAWPAEPGLQGQVLASLRAARDLEPEYVFYTEPNKPQFFHGKLDEFFGAAEEHVANSSSFGVALPARSAESFSTYPAFQQHTESLISDLIRFLVDREAVEDVLYGPRLIAPQLLPVLDQLKAKIGWGWMCFLLIVAHRLARDIVTIPMDLECPIAERVDDNRERLLRLNQLRDHIGGIHEALQVMRHD
jgi:hypothetical protein